MNIYEYTRLRSILDFAQGHLQKNNNNKLVFSETNESF